MLFPSTDDGTRIEAYAEVVGSNLTQSIFINLVNYGIVSSAIFQIVRQTIMDGRN